MSVSLYMALQANGPLTTSAISEGKDIAKKTVKHTMVFIRRMNENIRIQSVEQPSDGELKKDK